MLIKSAKILYGISQMLAPKPDILRYLNDFEEYAEFTHDIIQYFSMFDMRMDKPDMITPYFKNLPKEIWNAGKIPLLTWYAFTDNLFATPEDICERIADGIYDDYLAKCCECLLDFINESKENSILGKPKLYLRFAHEMNAGYLNWANKPEEYKRMWIHVYSFINNYDYKKSRNALVSKLTSNEIQFIFCPGSFVKESFPFEEYYPGDKYVDWLGLTGYNWGNNAGMNEIFSAYLERMNKLTNKPISISEFGSTSWTSFDDGSRFDDETKWKWVKESYEWFINQDIIEKYNIRMAIYFNESRNNDIDSGIFIPDIPTVRNNTLSFTYVKNDLKYKSIKNLSKAYVCSERNTKIGFVNSELKICQDIFEGNF